jgi:GIY-YIG catalytic domain
VPTPDDVTNYLAANIHSRAEVLARPCPVPREPGVYGWWFRDLPADMNIANCETRDGLTLLYAGISPKQPPTNGRAPSKEALRSRINTHYTGNAEGSTLRLTLGCLLSEGLNLELRRYGSGKRMHFGVGERELPAGLAANAFVSWLTTPDPWLLEEHLFKITDLPLNLDQNRHHAFWATLNAKRVAAKAHARSLPALPNPGIGGASID